MNYRRWSTGGISGCPKAPLIGEVLGAGHMDWLDISKSLNEEYPFLSAEELEKQLKERRPADQLVFADLINAGYRSSAEEIARIMKANKVATISEDSLKTMARDFCICEDFSRNGLWRDIILLRTSLATAFFKSGDVWLAEQVFRSCTEYGNRLNDRSSSDRNLKAEIELILAFILMQNEDNNVDEEVIAHLKNCQQFGENTHNNQLLTRDVNSCDASDAPRAPSASCSELVLVELDRPIALHNGWKGIQGTTAVVKASESTPFRIGSLLWSDLLMKTASEMTKHNLGIKSGAGGKRKDKSETMAVRQIDSVYNLAIEKAHQGQNPTIIQNALYSHGRFCLEMALYENAEKIFLDLHLYSRRFKDYETLGIAFNGLGRVCIAKQNLEDALGHFCEEWRVGWKHKLGDIVVDSTREIGRLLLEEGQLIEAENCCRESFEKHSELMEARDSSIQLDLLTSETLERCSNEGNASYKMSYDHSWVMSGIATGQSLVMRMAGLLRREHFVHDILEWKTNRKPLPSVPRPIKPSTISKASKYWDIKHLSKKHEEKERERQEHHVRHLTPQEHLDDWIKLVDEEEYVFMNDIGTMAYRDRVIAQTRSINMSLSMAMEDEHNLLRKDLRFRTSHNDRVSVITRLLQVRRYSTAEDFEAAEDD